jgi:hypothetical protein
MNKTFSPPQTDSWENVKRDAKVIVTTSSKWVYMLNSVEKWLCESQKKKSVVDSAISI